MTLCGWLARQQQGIFKACSKKSNEGKEEIANNQLRKTYSRASLGQPNQRMRQGLCGCQHTNDMDPEAR